MSQSTGKMRPMSSLAGWVQTSQPAAAGGSRSQPAASSSKAGSKSKPATSDPKGKKRAKLSDAIEISDDDDDVEIVGTSSPRKPQRPVGTPADEELWASRFKPADEDELVVHKKKVEDVRRWFKEAFFDPRLSKYRRVLVLSGPSGSGKTATVRVLADELDFDINEFIAPDQTEDSLVHHFSAFLSRSGATLKFGADKSAATPVKKKRKVESKRPSIVLIEDLPNIFSSSETRAAFRRALTSYATSSRPSETQQPLVIIVSEAIARGSVEAEQAHGALANDWQDNVTARTVVPIEVLKGGKCHEIRFNPVAKTLLKKALNATLERACPESNRPGADVLDLVIASCNGDIRSALNCLQFVVQDPKRAGSLVPATKSKSKGKAKKVGKRDAALVRMITARESSLFLFHALGKVLFSKRWGEKPDEDAKEADDPPKKPKIKLAPHLSHYKRSMSKVEPNTLFADAPVDANMMLAYIHQNYPPFTDTIDQCADILDSFSLADSVLSIEGERFDRHPLTSHYSFQIAVRGTMMGLPAPVPRRGQRMTKAMVWIRNRVQRERETVIPELVLGLSRAAQSSLSGKRELVRDIVPYLALTPADSKIRKALPTHCLDLVRDLAVFPAIVDAERAGRSGAMLDEHDAEADSTALDPTDGPAPGAVQALPVPTGKLQALYLSDDDIED